MRFFSFHLVAFSYVTAAGWQRRYRDSRLNVIRCLSLRTLSFSFYLFGRRRQHPPVPASPSLTRIPSSKILPISSPFSRLRLLPCRFPYFLSYFWKTLFSLSRSSSLGNFLCFLRRCWENSPNETFPEFSPRLVDDRKREREKEKRGIKKGFRFETYPSSPFRVISGFASKRKSPWWTQNRVGGGGGGEEMRFFTFSGGVKSMRFVRVCSFRRKQNQKWFFSYKRGEWEE